MFYLARRIGFTFLVLIGISGVMFFISHSLPTDPITSQLGEGATSNPEIVAAFRAKWGMDDPLPVQYWNYVTGLVHGDMGVSLFSHRDVVTDLTEFFPATTELATAAIFIGLLVSVPLGIIAAVTRGQIADRVIRAVTLFGVSMPIFWLGMMMLEVFYVRLNWAPPPDGRLAALNVAPPHLTGWYTIDALWAGDFPTFWDAVVHLIMPAVVLSTWTIGLLTRMTRSAMLDILGQDYIRVARSRGAGSVYVIMRHALPNALLSIIDVIGLAYAQLMAGAVVVENTFSWPGIGKYAYSAATLNDFPGILGVALIVALVYLAINLIVDGLHLMLDPRIRLAGH